MSFMIGGAKEDRTLNRYVCCSRTLDLAFSGEYSAWECYKLSFSRWIAASAIGLPVREWAGWDSNPHCHIPGVPVFQVNAEFKFALLRTIITCLWLLCNYGLKIKSKIFAPIFCSDTSMPFASSRANFTASCNFRTRSSSSATRLAGIAPEYLIVCHVPTITSS